MNRKLTNLAAGDFSPWLDALTEAGLEVAEPIHGALQLGCGGVQPDRLLLSVGVHGDETLPISLLADALARLAASPKKLAIDLLIVVANLPAIAAGRRFIEFDLNRLFRTDAAADTAEGIRAAQLRRTAEQFFAGARAGRVHLDLHSTIKASLFPNFAVLPYPAESAEAAWLTAWLERAGFEAALFSDLPSSTFSGFTARHCGAVSATLEMGMRGDLGSHSLAELAGAAEALQKVFERGLAHPGQGKPLLRFRAVREIVRRTDRFRLGLVEGAPNFSAFAAGDLIAVDGEVSYRAVATGERIVFPNAEVALGLRAGIIVVPVD